MDLIHGPTQPAAYSELISKCCRIYNCLRAQYEHPEAIWLASPCTRGIVKYGIFIEDIYNSDETGFQMGVAATAKVVTRAGRANRPVLVQPGNRERVFVINVICASGWASPLVIIFEGKMNQISWYEAGIPKDWPIDVSDNDEQITSLTN